MMAFDIDTLTNAVRLADCIDESDSAEARDLADLVKKLSLEGRVFAPSDKPDELSVHQSAVALKAVLTALREEMSELDSDLASHLLETATRAIFNVTAVMTKAKVEAAVEELSRKIDAGEVELIVMDTMVPDIDKVVTPDDDEPTGDEVSAARWIASARCLLSILKRNGDTVGNMQLLNELLDTPWPDRRDWDQMIALLRGEL